MLFAHAFGRSLPRADAAWRHFKQITVIMSTDDDDSNDDGGSGSINWVTWTQSTPTNLIRQYPILKKIRQEGVSQQISPFRCNTKILPRFECVYIPYSNS